eukprot:SAG31_NODE_3370_length_4353_cov_5.039962_1_plen_25_part_10
MATSLQLTSSYIISVAALPWWVLGV